METSLSQQQIDSLIEHAREAREQAYAPYSRFKVGAALLTAEGRVYRGCNVENGSFGLTLCAERAAMANAIINGSRDFEAIAVVAETEDAPITPCGACRQSLVEFNPHLTIISASTKGRARIFRLDELLPHHFEFER